jgi:hypothetical protein
MAGRHSSKMLGRTEDAVDPKDFNAHKQILVGRTGILIPKSNRSVFKGNNYIDMVICGNCLSDPIGFLMGLGYSNKDAQQFLDETKLGQIYDFNTKERRYEFERQIVVSLL